MSNLSVNLSVPGGLPAGWRLERMTALSIAEMMAIELRAYPFPWSQRNFEDSVRSGYVGLLLRDEHRQLVGYAIVMPVVDEVHLLNITIAPEQQRRGLGAWLLQAVADTARAAGYHGVLLEVRPSNGGAIALYLRTGFVEVGRRRGYYPAAGGTREDALVMRLHWPAAVEQTADAHGGSRP